MKIIYRVYASIEYNEIAVVFNCLMMNIYTYLLCMYACMYVCMYVRMYVCVYVRVWTSMRGNDDEFHWNNNDNNSYLGQDY